MNHALLNLTDKVTRMIHSAVYLAVATRAGGATPMQICTVIRDSDEADPQAWHSGLVERALGELQRQGRVVRESGLWYPAPQSL